MDFLATQIYPETGDPQPKTIVSLNIFARLPSQKLDLAPENFRLEKRGRLEDRYEIKDFIGKGGFGEVKKIRDTVTNEIRALKIMLKSKCQMTENISDEIRILQKLDHPNVMRFYEFYSDESNYYLVTEYCEGGDLLAMMAKQRSFTEKNAALIMRQILSAVEYCHKNKIVHRDLKPENCVFAGEALDSTIKVIDFGRSKMLEPTEQITDKAGSLYYVAPEVLADSQYNGKCDIWSCGVIMYLMIAGFPPFYGSRQEVIKSIVAGNIEYTDPIWETVSEEAKSTVKKMLVRDPKLRISASDALKEPWITKNANGTNNISNGDLRLSLRKLCNFRTQLLFQSAVLSYIASQTLTQKEEAKIRQIFDIFDSDRDGKLCKKDLFAGLKFLYGDEKKAKKQADNIFKNIDVNNKGAIDYNQFLMANLEMQSISDEENLKKAFEFYDTGNNGFITLEEVKKVFGSISDDNTLKRLMDDADSNHDGKISFPDFKAMMEKYKKSCMEKPGVMCASEQILGCIALGCDQGLYQL